nr:endogenous retrovirus group PABLB member 1 Env polyprotein-like [Cavia porcellus]
MFYVLLLLGVLSQIGHTQDESNSFLVWATQYAQDVRDDPSWVCGVLPTSTKSRLSWWVSPLQGNDWSKLQGYIHEAQAESVVLRRATRSDVSKWPICMTLNQEGHGKSFSKHETDAIIERFFEPFHSKNVSLHATGDENHRYKDVYYQIWDEQLWLTPSLGYLSQVAPLCWEQRHSSHSSWTTNSKFLGWIPLKWCQHIIVLWAKDWFATDWSSRPGVRWAAPNGTQWLCGRNLWPWLPPGWVGRCTLGFPWMQGRWSKVLDQPANLSVSPHSRNHSELPQHNGLSSNSARFVGLRDVIWHIDSLAQYLDKVVNHMAKEMSLLDFEDQLMRKAALQHQMALDTLKAAKGGKCAVLQNECCVHLPNQKHVGPGLNSSTERVWASRSKISRRKWLITIAGVVLALILIGSVLVEILLSFISSNLQPVYEGMVLFHANPVVYIEPRATPPGSESEQERGP